MPSNVTERTQILGENDLFFDDDLEEEDLGFRYDQFTPKNQVSCQKRSLLCYIVVGFIVTLTAGILIGRFTAPTDKNISNLSRSSSSWSYNSTVSKDVLNEIKAENIRNNLKILTNKPHVAGSEQNEEYLVNFIKDRWESYLDAVEVFPYDVLLSFPNETDKNYVAMTYPNGSVTRKSTPDEKSITEDEKNATIVSAFNAYSPPGHVEGNMFYVNFGRREDFALLAIEGINVSGSICVARYGYIFRGDKVKFAEQHNCSALVLYSDPLDYGGFSVNSWEEKSSDNSSYPNSWWLPMNGFQRGTIMTAVGDPLTPGYPAFLGNFTYRIPVTEATLPTIPVLPISYKDAYQYLSILNGTDAPDDWQGGFKLKYKFGGSFVASHTDCKAVVHVANYMQRKVVRTVIGYIRGAVEPDRYVLLGNHRDAWTFGGADPSSGTAVVLEVSRAIAEVVKGGKLRPRRTLVFCNWAAEEYGLIGSTEWVEQMEKRLLMQAVSYTNIDIAVQGTFSFRAFACPSLNQLLFNATKSVTNPNYNEIMLGRSTVYDTWLHNMADHEISGQPFVHNLGSGSDYTSFLQKSGVASVDIRYTFDGTKNISSYPVYHSLHDTFEYFENFLDRDFNFSVAVASVAAESVLQMSSLVVLPLNPLDTARELTIMAKYLQDSYKDIFNAKNISLDELHRIIQVFNEAANELMRQVKELNESSSDIHVRMINDKLFTINRGFLDFKGLSGRRYFRNVVFAPSSLNSYNGAGFPSVNDAAIEAEKGGSLENVKKELSILCIEILSAAQLMRNL